MTLVLPALNT